MSTTPERGSKGDLFYLKLDHTLQHYMDTLQSRGGWTRSRALLCAELAQLDFPSKLLAGVTRSLETGGNIYVSLWLLKFVIKLSLTNPIPSILASYQCIQCLLHSCKPL